MKKMLLGVLVGFVVAVPAGAWAWGANQAAPLIKGAECSFVTGNDNVSYPSSCTIRIDKFTDSGNVCYVAVGGTGDNIPAISCLRK